MNPLNQQFLDAARSGQNKKIKQFLDSGIDPNIMHGGQAALHWAAIRDNIDMAKMLLEKGADIDIKHSVSLETPLMLALFNGKINMAKFLLKLGADINGVTINDPNKVGENAGNSTLHVAASSGSLELVKLLLDRGLDINAKNVEGNTPLVTAAYGGKIEVVKFLYQEYKKNGIEMDDNEKSAVLECLDLF